MAASRNSPTPDPVAVLREFLAARVRPGERLCVALSGGCDSLVLSAAVARLALPNPLSALHVHHGLSSRADAWVDHCRQQCNAWGIPLDVRRVEVVRDSGLGLEAAAREARYQQFAACDAHALLLGHHGDDQAETLLFNLLRGCGVRGAAAMPPERLWAGPRLLRPFLGLSRDDLESWARAQGLSWVEDESNGDVAYARNFLRREILPRLKERFPAVVERLGAATGHFAEAESLLAELAAEDWARLAADDGTIPAKHLPSLSMPRLKNLLRFRLGQLGWRVPEASRLEEFARQLREAAPDRHPELSLPDGKMQVAGRRLRWVAR